MAKVLFGAFQSILSNILFYLLKHALNHDLKKIQLLHIVINICVLSSDIFLVKCSPKNVIFQYDKISGNLNLASGCQLKLQSRQGGWCPCCRI